jgi:hypothetical protein
MRPLQLNQTSAFAQIRDSGGYGLSIGSHLKFRVASAFESRMLSPVIEQHLYFSHRSQVGKLSAEPAILISAHRRVGKADL